MDDSIRPRRPNDPPPPEQEGPCEFTDAQALAADRSYHELKISGRLAAANDARADALQTRYGVPGERA